MTLRNRRLIYWSGYALFIFGLVVVCAASRIFDRLVNYQRIAMTLPLFYSLPMIMVDTLVDWKSANNLDRIRAVGAVFMSLLLTFGCLMWLFMAPTERAS
jgi:hypothetical protein